MKIICTAIQKRKLTDLFSKTDDFDIVLRRCFFTKECTYISHDCKACLESEIEWKIIDKKEYEKKNLLFNWFKKITRKNKS